jgi:hypothetical protein
LEFYSLFYCTLPFNFKLVSGKNKIFIQTVIKKTLLYSNKLTIFFILMLFHTN